MFLNKNEIAKKLNKPVEEVKIGVTCSCFDLLHAGHVVMLQEAKSICDYLICCLQVDPTLDRPDTKNKPIQSVFERYLQLSSCKYVDEIIPYATEKELEDILLTLNPDIRIIGEEYKGKDFTGKNLSSIYYNKRRHSFSTSDLRKRVCNSNAN